MVITSPSILAATILGSMLMLAIRTFIFSKSLISSYASLRTSKTALLGLSQFHQDESTTTRFTTGPFTIRILKITALASLLSLVIFATRDFQQFSITFSLWLKNTPTTVSLRMLYDQYSIIFITVALLVT